jgi:type I restriction enzyme S subunit
VLGSFGITGYHDTATTKSPGVTVGRSGASFGVVTYSPVDFWALNTALYVIDFHGNDELFAYYFLKSIDFQRYNSGGAQPSLNRNFIYPIPVKIPPLPEQKAIAQSLSDADALIAALDQLITKKRDIKQGTMQQLLTAKKRLPGFSGVWEEKSLGEIVDIDSDNLKSDTSPNYCFNYISLEDVEQGKLKNFSHCIFSSAPSRARRRVRKNDILVATVRPHLKSHLFVRFEIKDLICSTGFAVIRCNSSEISAEFIYHHFFANVIEQQFNTLLVGSNYPAVNSSDIKNLKIPLPSFNEQKAIAQILSDMDSEIEALEQKRDKYKALKQGMMQELLTGKTRLIDQP